MVGTHDWNDAPYRRLRILVVRFVIEKGGIYRGTGMHTSCIFTFDFRCYGGNSRAVSLACAVPSLLGQLADR